ncbi:hypothetical protein [Formosa algae]|uniref:Uncharacterized protein n=1 Tax=Formosa algae TaxID=225843 RepID=A0A9X1CDV9_9FLAO|nr:hypothetical protein [Formosa algae]MBP1841685.1 hypothetical protein [Formosa algae]MDQ0337114.1 hypothetical protein [Formosa algae]
MKKNKKSNKIETYILCFTLITLVLSCRQKNELEYKSDITKKSSVHSKLIFPDSILKNSMFGKFEYYYDLPDSLIPDKGDYSLMTIYAQLTKDIKDPSKINIKECDSFFAERKNFKDTLISPIFFRTKDMKGQYYLSGKGIIKSLPANNGRKDTISDLTMHIREFSFSKLEPIKINE